MFAGGNGGKGADSTTGTGAPGGSSAGTAVAGTSGPDPWSTATASAAPSGGGIGGNGGATIGSNGNVPASGNGGGGGGAGEAPSVTSCSIGGAGVDGKVIITYTVVSVPTVTTQAATNKEATTATCNGTITVTGGVNSTNAGCEWDIDTGAPYANTASTAGSYGAAPFTQALTGLPTGTTIYARAFATNPAGTSYGGEVNFLTKPAAPTNVAATDGTATDKVTITWTKSTGATGYKIYEGSKTD